MSANRAKPRAAVKSARCPEGQQKPSEAEVLSPVMRRLRVALGERKSAARLHYLTEQPLSICEKTLAGNRLPNAAMYEALFGTELIIPTILGLIPDDATDPRVRAVRKAIRRLELDFEDGEGA